MAQEPDVETKLVDLSDLRLSELLDQDPAIFQESLDAYLRRIDEPSQTISGYQPQRLD